MSDKLNPSKIWSGRLLGTMLSSGILCCLLGCWTGASRNRVPGTYMFSREGYTTKIAVRSDGTYTQTRTSPHGSSMTQTGHWSTGPLEGHITMDRVLPFYPEDSDDLSKTSFYTPEVDVIWMRVCLLVDGNKDLYMCKER